MATQAQIKAYIEMLAPLCQKYAKEYGFKVCSPAIAQAMQESLTKNGLSGLATKYHNHHGLKCGSSWIKAGKPRVNLKTGEEYTVGKISSINDWFRVFSNDAEGIEGYFIFLQAKRYQNLKNVSDPFQYMALIKQDGYCTSSTYVQNCSDKIRKYDLQRFDEFKPINPYPTYKIGATYITTANLFVRCEPKGAKKNLSELSLNAKKNAYDDGEGHGILKKGTKVTCKALKVVGNQTWYQIPSGWICAIDGNKIYIE